MRIWSRLAPCQGREPRACSRSVMQQVTSLMGPAASNADSIITLLQQTTRGDSDLGDWYRTALDNTPFLNIFWLRTAMNGLILNRIQDALDPGSLERYQRRVEREQGNEFLVPPSQFMLGK